MVQCQATTKKGHQCSREAKKIVNGENLCTQHANLQVVHSAVEQKITVPSDDAGQCQGTAKSTGKRCKLGGKYNGFCHFHVAPEMKKDERVAHLLPEVQVLQGSSPAQELAMLRAKVQQLEQEHDHEAPRQQTFTMEQVQQMFRTMMAQQGIAAKPIPSPFQVEKPASHWMTTSEVKTPTSGRHTPVRAPSPPMKLAPDLSAFCHLEDEDVPVFSLKNNALADDRCQGTVQAGPRKGERCLRKKNVDENGEFVDGYCHQHSHQTKLAHPVHHSVVHPYAPPESIPA
jgi:hypothetical protein